MPWTRYILAVAMIFLAPVPFGFAQGGGPPGGQTTILAIDPTATNILYVCTKGSGLFKTTDGGASWTAVKVGLDGIPECYAIAVDSSSPETVYVGTGTVYKTSNGGASWRSSDNGLPDSPSVPINSLVVDPVSANTVYALTQYGVFKT